MLILGAVLALAQADAAAAITRPDGHPPAETAATVCQAVAVTSPQMPKRRGTFSATKILDLQLGTILRTRLAGDQVLNLRVYTPKGHLYQQIDVPFHGPTLMPSGAAVEAAETTPRLRHVDGYPQPLPEQELVPVSTSAGRGYQVSALLPVGGTSIMTSSLYGRWKVVPHLNGSQKACGKATLFSITQ